MSKYRFYTDSANTTYCVSSFAGKEVRGATRLDPRDTNNPELAKKIAQAKCDYKISVKRVKLSMTRTEQARQDYLKAKAIYEDKLDYLNRAIDICEKYDNELTMILRETQA